MKDNSEDRTVVCGLFRSTNEAFKHVAASLSLRAKNLQWRRANIGPYNEGNDARVYKFTHHFDDQGSAHKFIGAVAEVAGNTSVQMFAAQVRPAEVRSTLEAQYRLHFAKN